MVEQWKNYGNKALFKKDSSEIKKFADIFYSLDDDKKTEFLKQLKLYLTGKSDVPTFPDDTADEWIKSDYFFTLSPQYVIGFSATYQIKHDANKKKEVENAMTLDNNDQKRGLDKKIYGDGEKFTEEGIIKYYAEELGGVNHSYFKGEKKKQESIPQEGFWRANNPAAWLGGLGLLFLIGAIGWVIHKRKTILQWWNSPSELEDEFDEDEEED